MNTSWDEAAFELLLREARRFLSVDSALYPDVGTAEDCLDSLGALHPSILLDESPDICVAMELSLWKPFASSGARWDAISGGLIESSGQR